jgi:ribosomal-protein-alanine N-acetyltransferase
MDGFRERVERRVDERTVEKVLDDSVSLRLPLRTPRLTLRDFAPNDFDAIHAHASDAEVTRYMFYGPRTVADTHAYLDRMLASQRAKPRLIWELGAVVTAEDRLVGACDLTLEDAQEGDLGFIFSRDVWGMGYATEAAAMLVRAGFEQLGLIRIFSTCDVANGASARVLEKAGLQREAVLEQHKYARGRWWTSFLYAVRREQWSPE